MTPPKQIPCHCCSGKGERPCYETGDLDHCDCWANGDVCCACGYDGDHGGDCTGGES